MYIPEPPEVIIVTDLFDAKSCSSSLKLLTCKGKYKFKILQSIP